MGAAGFGWHQALIPASSRANWRAPVFQILPCLYFSFHLIVNTNLQKPKGLFAAVGYKPGGFLYENTPGAWMKYRLVGGGVKSGVAG